MQRTDSRLLYHAQVSSVEPVTSSPNQIVALAQREVPILPWYGLKVVKLGVGAVLDAQIGDFFAQILVAQHSWSIHVLACHVLRLPHWMLHYHVSEMVLK